MAEEKKVRSFRDRGSLRFRSQDIDELARSLGLGSDPDLQLGEVPPPKKTSSPSPSKRPKGGKDDEVFDFNLSALIMEVFWVLISFVGIYRYFRLKALRSETLDG